MKAKKGVAIVICLVLFAILLNILPSNLTGGTILTNEKSPAKIDVVQDFAVYGEDIQIKIESPYYMYRNKKVEYWVGDKIYFYNDVSRKGEKKICENSLKCRGTYTIEYPLPIVMYTGVDWKPGKYIVKVYDYLTKKYIEDSFILTDLNDSRIMCKDSEDSGDDIYHKGTTYSYLTGSQVKKEDKCIATESYDSYSSKELGEYYCCNKTDKNYIPSIGMCYKRVSCNKKCEKGSCWN